MAVAASLNHLKAPDCRNCPVRHRSLMANLDDNALGRLDQEKSCNVYRKGTVIFHEANKPFGLYTVFSGKVKLFKTSEQGKEQIVRLAKPGDPIGYRSLISGENYFATAEAMEDSRLCFIPWGTFKNLMAEGQGVFDRLMAVMSEDLKSAEDRVVSMATKTVRERTAEALIMLKNYYGLKPDGQTLDVQLSREDLANFIGTATESLIRMLADFKQEKLIEIKDKNIHLLNIPKLTQVANIYD